MHKKYTRGFSMIELMFAIAIATITGLIATSSIISIKRTSDQTRDRALVDQELKMMTEFMVSNTQSIGGGAVRSWRAVRVEDNFEDKGSDRLLIGELNTAFPECNVTAVNGEAKIQINENADGTCCLTAAMAGQQGVLSSASLDRVMYGIITDVNTNKCELKLDENNNNVVLKSLTTANTQKVDFLAGGVISVIKPRIFQHDALKNELTVTEINSENKLQTSVVADRVFDLQFALGYDINPVDGKITDSSSTEDEWTNNSTDPEDLFGKGGLLGARDSDLRMISVGMIIGTPVKDDIQGQEVSIFNGDTKTSTDFQLRAATGRGMMRNLFLFQ